MEKVSFCLTALLMLSSETISAQSSYYHYGKTLMVHLSGLSLKGVPQKGVYIRGGRKYIVR